MPQYGLMIDQCLRNVCLQIHKKHNQIIDAQYILPNTKQKIVRNKTTKPT